MLSSYNNEDSYSLMLSPDSSTAAAVTLGKGSGGLISLTMANSADPNFPLLGLETQTVSDVGKYPVSTEFLLLTNVGASATGSVFPDATASDSQVYLGESVVWSANESTGSIVPIWQNPQGSNPQAAQLILFMLCADDGTLDNCFLTAASDRSTFDNFDTDGVTITRVAFSLLPLD